MTSKLPLIVGFGGYNAAGRSSGHQAYRRMILESLSESSRTKVLAELGALMGLDASEESKILEGSLIRKIRPNHFDTEAAPYALNITLDSKHPAEFELSARQLPENIPPNWEVLPMDEEGRRVRVKVQGDIDVRAEVTGSVQVKAAGQLPDGFNPGDYYRSTHHPRGLQMTVLAASDAVNNIGIPWSQVLQSVHPDDIAVYCSSVMSQLDLPGFGGMMTSRIRGQRATSKQLSLGFTSMPGDFTNAYVLGSLGGTGAVTGACATFLYNLRWASEEIRAGRRKVAVVGCSEAPILPEVIDGFAAMSALATDADLCKLDGLEVPDYRRASRPFGDNCGFTLGESSQFVVLMSDELALELGAEIYGAVPGVYVNADGYKKSISAPGAGNYLTMAKAMGLAKSLLGEQALKHKSFIQAHGSSTPHNRTTESKIFDEMAAAFGIEQWPVVAVKSYLGHSLGPASGDQLNCSLGIFDSGVLPGIKTISGVADDVFAKRLQISNRDEQRSPEDCEIAFLNSKGFGGNNATACVLSPMAAKRFIEKKHGKSAVQAYASKRENTLAVRDAYLADAAQAKLNAVYEFGTNLIDETEISISEEHIKFPGYELPVSLNVTEGFEPF